MVWTIYVLTSEEELFEILIDENKTFADFKRKASEKVNIPFNDLVFVADVEYDKTYNSKKLCDIGYPFQNYFTLFAVLKINGGNRLK